MSVCLSKPTADRQTVLLEHLDLDVNILKYPHHWEYEPFLLSLTQILRNSQSKHGGMKKNIIRITIIKHHSYTYPMAKTQGGGGLDPNRTQAEQVGREGSVHRFIYRRLSRKRSRTLNKPQTLKSLEHGNTRQVAHTHTRS